MAREAVRRETVKDTDTRSDAFMYMGSTTHSYAGGPKQVQLLTTSLTGTLEKVEASSGRCRLHSAAVLEERSWGAPGLEKGSRHESSVAALAVSIARVL